MAARPQNATLNDVDAQVIFMHRSGDVASIKGFARQCTMCWNGFYNILNFWMYNYTCYY